MVNVFGGSFASGPGNLQVVKKIVVTVGKFKDYSDEIKQSYVLGFTRYRLQKNVDGTFVTPIRVYSGRCWYWTMLLRWGLAIGISKRIR